MTGSRIVPTPLSTGDVARALGISRQAVHLRVQNGTIEPYAKTHYGYLFTADEVERVRAERQNGRRGDAHKSKCGS